MQEYCYRSNRRDATKAFVKLLVNNLRKRKITQMKQRYLHPLAAANSKVRSAAWFHWAAHSAIGRIPETSGELSGTKRREGMPASAASMET